MKDPRRAQLLRISQLRSWLTIISGAVHNADRYVDHPEAFKGYTQRVEEQLNNALSIARELRQNIAR